MIPACIQLQVKHKLQLHTLHITVALLIWTNSLQGLIRTIEDSAGGGDQASMTLRGFAYTAVGCLAQRVPTLFHSRIDIARNFFAGVGVGVGVLLRAYAFVHTTCCGFPTSGCK